MYCAATVSVTYISRDTLDCTWHAGLLYRYYCRRQSQQYPNPSDCGSISAVAINKNGSKSRQRYQEVLQTSSLSAMPTKNIAMATILLDYSAPNRHFDGSNGAFEWHTLLEIIIQIWWRHRRKCRLSPLVSLSKLWTLFPLHSIDSGDNGAIWFEWRFLKALLLSAIEKRYCHHWNGVDGDWVSHCQCHHWRSINCRHCRHWRSISDGTFWSP